MHVYVQTLHIIILCEYVSLQNTTPVQVCITYMYTCTYIIISTHRNNQIQISTNSTNLSELADVRTCVCEITICETRHAVGNISLELCSIILNIRT